MFVDKEDLIRKIKEIVNKCIDAGLQDQLKNYTIPYLRQYLLLFNPTADNRINPWKYLIKQLEESPDNISLDLEEFAEDFIREVNICYNDNIQNNLTESKQKIEEASRNELLALAKSQTKTRYDKSSGYKGFSLVDIDTTTIFTTDTITVTCKVGKYYDTVELQDILIWIQMESERNENNQVNTKAITAALMEAIDALEIKVNCTCPDWAYRFAYQATQLDYKYGKPENRPANITNPHNYGSLCKHLISMLSNKKWLQQVTGTIMDYIEKNIDKVNEYLRPKEGQELTLPNELARRNAKKGFYTKLFKDKLQDEEPEEDDTTENDAIEDTDQQEPVDQNDNQTNQETDQNIDQNNEEQIEQGPQKHI